MTCQECLCNIPVIYLGYAICAFVMLCLLATFLKIVDSLNRVVKATDQHNTI